MINHVWTSPLLRSTMVRWNLVFIALFAATLLFVSPTHAAGVVGNGTAASCTEAALEAALAGGGVEWGGLAGAPNGGNIYLPLVLK